VNGAPRIGLAVGAAAVSMIASRSALMLIGAAVAGRGKECQPVKPDTPTPRPASDCGGATSARR
jgi:hypothetical protein